MEPHRVSRDYSSRFVRRVTFAFCVDCNGAFDAMDAKKAE